MKTDMNKKYRDRANRARRALIKEKEKYGSISDGSGKRYGVSVDFVICGAPEKAVEFIEWYEQEFPDDIGEPVFFLYGALAYYRTGTPRKARSYLLDAMLSNIYMLPYLYGRPLPKQNMWHSNNQVMPEYIDVIIEFLDVPTIQEREWFRMQFEGELFTEIREKYIETFNLLQHTEEVDARIRIHQEWLDYLSSRRENEILRPGT